MKHPRRIAVVILCALVGLAAQRIGGLESGTLLGLLAAFVIAPLVPIPAAR